jgi:hypothetical protein
LINLGTNYQSEAPVNFSAMLQFRTTRRDLFEKQAITNTGGQWVYLVPALNLKLVSPIAIRLNAHIPVHRKLNGTQLTSSYKLSIALFYQFNPENRN